MRSSIHCHCYYRHLKKQKIRFVNLKERRKKNIDISVYRYTQLAMIYEIQFNS